MFISGIRSFGIGSTLGINHIFDSKKVFISIIFPFKERFLWDWVFVHSSIWRMHACILQYFVCLYSLLKCTPKVRTNSSVHHVIRYFWHILTTVFVCISKPLVSRALRVHPVAILYFENFLKSKVCPQSWTR